MKLPKNYRQLPLEKYQEVFPIVKRILLEEDEDKRYFIQLELLEAFGVDHSDLNIGEIAKLIKRISFLKSNPYQLVHKRFMFKGRIYKAVNNPEKLNTGQYMSIKMLCHDNIISELHNIAPICYKQLTIKGYKYTDKDHTELAEWFKKQPASKSLPIVFFCLKVYEHWTKNTDTYCQAMKIIQSIVLEAQELQSEKNFLIDGAGMQL